MKSPNPFLITSENVVVFHHAYTGLLLMLGSLGQNFMFWIGVLIFLDDVYEHLIDYSSPLRIVFDKWIAPRLY